MTILKKKTQETDFWFGPQLAERKQNEIAKLIINFVTCTDLAKNPPISSSREERLPQSSHQTWRLGSTS